MYAESQRRITTLWELMRPFRVNAFFSDLRSLLKMASECKGYSGDVAPDYKDHLLPLLDNLHKKMEDSRFPLSDLYVQRWVSQIRKIGTTYEQVCANCEELSQRLEDECTAFAVYAIPSDQKAFLNQPALFGQEVTDAFPGIAFDVEEAGNCYAFDRATACVFHLMRVMESGLRSLGKSLNDSRFNPQTNPTWEAILRRCDEELSKPLAQRSPEWKVNDAFFGEATANLRAVKNAWRNPTMHIETVYDTDKALDVLNAVKGFMRHLSTKLKG